MAECLITSYQAGVLKIGTDIMGSTAHCMALLSSVLVIVISHGLLCEGARHTSERKYYPEEPPVKTIELESGDVVDCVDFYSQPAMRHPSMRSIKRQPRPTVQPQEASASNDSAGEEAAGIGLKSGSCPPGTVPILKATKAGPLNHSAIDSFARLRARSRGRLNSTETLNAGIDQPPDAAHEYAYSAVHSGRFGGAQASFNVWNPTLENFNEMSLSQMWFFKRSPDGNLATLEAGWMVNPSFFGDYETRLFAFSTPDSYQTFVYNYVTGPGTVGPVFTQVSSRIYLGAILTSSIYEGPQQEMFVTMKKDLPTGNWNFSVDGELIGYWPKYNYREDFDLGETIEWGGEVVNRWNMGRHTSTQMGNGHFASEGRGKAAYISNMGLFDGDLVYYDAPFPLSTSITNFYCYDTWDWGDLGGYGHRTITIGGSGYDGGHCS